MSIPEPDSRSIDDIFEELGRGLNERSLGSKRLNRVEALAMAKRWLETSRESISAIICQSDSLKSISAGGKNERGADLAAALIDLHSSAISATLGIPIPLGATLCVLIAKLGVAYFCEPKPTQ